MNRHELELLYKVMVEYYGFEFNIKCRLRKYSEAKEMFAYIARLRGATWDSICRMVNWKDHASAVYAFDTMEDLISIYPLFQKQFDEILEELNFRNTFGLLVNDEKKFST